MSLNPNVHLPKQSITTKELNALIIDSIQDIKGKNIVLLDLTQLDEAPADYFIICEGDSTTQVKAIADRVQQRAKQEGFTSPNHVEGQRESLWICVDYFTTVVHVFHKEKRGFYQLESLWSDADYTEFDNL